MSDLVTRLRRHPVICMDKQNITSDAADLIEQLQGDNDALHEATDQDQELNASLSKRIEQLEGEKEIFTDFEQQARWVEYKKWKVIIKDLKQKASQLAPPKG